MRCSRASPASIRRHGHLPLADPDGDTDTELCSWADSYRRLWTCLRCAGTSVHVAVVTRTREAQDAYRRTFDRWLSDRQPRRAAGLCRQRPPVTPCIVPFLLLSSHSQQHVRWGSLPARVDPCGKARRPERTAAMAAC